MDQWRWADGDDNGMSTSHDFVLHGVTMSRTGTVGVENYRAARGGSLGPATPPTAVVVAFVRRAV